MIIAGFIILNIAQENEEIINNEIIQENAQNQVAESNNKEGAKSMKVIMNNKEYEVELDNNDTTNDILSNVPFDLNIQRYADNEYYGELSFKPKNTEGNSEIQAGHIYYWDGWNAFVLNFEDRNIAPYKVVHIGEVKDKTIIDLLKNSEENISVKVTE